jgi:hypothetical protein
VKPATFLIATSLLLVSVKLLAEPALNANKALANAEAQAASEHKTIFLTFDAS